jgi:hypothetical protein
MAVRTDRKISHFVCMWIGLGIVAFLIALWSSNLWWSPRQLDLGVFSIFLSVLLLPVVLAYTTYQAAAWRAQSAISVRSSRWSTGLSRVMLWLTGAAGLLWWGIAADWLLSLLVTYVLFALLMIQVAAITGRAGYTDRRIWPDITACVCILALIVSAAVTSWPMRLLFHVSQDQLEALANRVEAGQSVDVPVWVAAFRIARTENRTPGSGGGTCLWVFPGKGNPTGLVRSDNSSAWGPGVNVNRKIRLSEHWYYISED